MQLDTHICNWKVGKFNRSSYTTFFSRKKNTGEQCNSYIIDMEDSPKFRESN